MTTALITVLVFHAVYVEIAHEVLRRRMRRLAMQVVEAIVETDRRLNELRED